MSIRVTFLGRLGNNLFQYALGRIIAEHHGFALSCDRLRPPTPRRLAADADVGPIATLESLAAFFPNAPLRITGQCHQQPVDAFVLARGNPWRGHRIDLPAILANAAPRRIHLAGYFQRIEYFAPYEDRLRHWFACRPVETPYIVAPEDVLVHIRRGADYHYSNWTLPVSYYTQLLDAMTNRGRVYVCGTCIDDEVRTGLERYQPIFYDESPLKSFAFIQRFGRIILSNSTFAWWAAYLSDASELYAARAPHPDAYGFTGYRDVDLHMRSTRYCEVDVRAKSGRPR